ncbi:MAG: dihydrodipicolinate synthase family protein [Nocardioides sp.]
MNTIQIEGVSGILVTPFDDQLQVDHASLATLARGMDEAGIDSVVSCGGLAEYYALTGEERLAITRTMVASVSRAVTLAAVGLGLENAVSEARAAVDAGADGILVHPTVHPYVHEEGLVDYYRAITDAVDVPIVAYVRDPALDDSAVLALADLPSVVAIKYAVNDLRRFADLVEASQGATAWMCGTAETWAPYFWQAGAVGYTSGIANFAPTATVRLRDALHGNLEVAGLRELWAPMRHFEAIRFRRHDRDSIPVVKTAVAAVGVGSDDVRPPMRRLDDATRAEIHTLLEDWDVLPA